MLDRAQRGPDGQLRSCLVRSCYAIFVSQGAVLLGVHRGQVHRSTWKDGGPASSWSQSRSCFRCCIRAVTLEEVLVVVAAAVAVAVDARAAASSCSSAMHRGGRPAAQRRPGPWRAWRCSSWSSSCSCFRCGVGLQRWRRLWQSRIQAQQQAPGRLLASWLESACSIRALSQVAVSIPVRLGGRGATSVLPLAVPIV